MGADRLVGVSPEGLATAVPLAGAGSRAIAGVIDLALQVLVIIVLAVAFTGDGVSAAARAVSVFVVLVCVPIAFDVLDRGRGPGKRIVGLRVVTLRGGAIGFQAAAIRNLLRIVDFLPSGYLIGMGAILATTTGQRLGDVAAGTVVTFVPGRDRKPKSDRVHARKTASASSAASAPPPNPPDTLPGTLAGPLAGTTDLRALAVDASQVTASEIGLVHSFLARRSTLPEEARRRLAGEIASRLRFKVMGVAADADDEAFLELVAAAKSVRR